MLFFLFSEGDGNFTNSEDFFLFLCFCFMGFGSGRWEEYL